MIRTHYSSDAKPGEDVTVAGWVDEKRDMGSITFIVMRDGRGKIQITAKKGAVSDSILEKLKELRKEAVIVVTGSCVASKAAPGGVEIIPKSVEIISDVTDIIPIEMNENIQTNLDKRLDFRSIDLRSKNNQAIFRIQSTLVQEIQDFFKKEGFMQIFTPCIMGV